MTFSATDDLLVRGVAAARDNDRDQARFFLEWTLRDAPTDEQTITAWYWLSRLTDEPAERRRCLEQVLSRSITHPEARRDLAILDGRLAPTEMIDPNQPLAPLTPTIAADPASDTRHHCPHCGGVVQFSVVDQALTCQHCGQQAAAPRTGAVDEQDWFATAYTARGHRWVLAATMALACPNCGATQTLPPGQVSSVCPWCAAPELVKTEAPDNLMAPDGIIPFAIDQAAARARLQQWQARQPAARRLTVPPPRPIYVPCWTFDIEAAAHWRRVTNNGDNSLSPGDLDVAPAHSGIAHLSFDDVLVPATPSLPAALVDGLDFATATPTPYADALLAGWPAELYRVPLTEASILARERALSRCRQAMEARSAIEKGELVVTRLELHMATYKLLLLPLWVTTVHHRDRPQTVIVNGQTGAVHGGESPGILGRLLTWLTGDSA